MKKLILVLIAFSLFFSVTGCAESHGYDDSIQELSGGNQSDFVTIERTEIDSRTAESHVTFEQNDESSLELISDSSSLVDIETESTHPPIPDVTFPIIQTLTILCDQQSKSFVEHLITSFRISNPYIIVEMICVEGDSNTYTAEVATALQNKNGADIVLLCDSRITKNTISLIQADRFADINALNSKYGYLNWNDYEETILDAGVFGNERYFLPVFYEIPLLIGIQDHLSAADVAYGKGVTFSQFTQSLANREKLIFRNPILPEGMYSDLGLNTIDQWNKTVNLKDEKLHAFIEGYNSLFPQILNGKYRSYVSQSNTYENALIGDLLAGDVLFLNNTATSNTPQFSNLPYLADIYSAILSENHTPILTTLPNTDGSETVYGRLGWCLGIRKGSENEDAALRFLAHAVSFEQYYSDSKYRGIPVNKTFNEATKVAYYENANHSNSNQIVGTEAYMSDSAAITSDFLDSYYDIISRVRIPRGVDVEHLNRLCNLFTDMQRNQTNIKDALQKVSEAFIEVFIN